MELIPSPKTDTFLLLNPTVKMNQPKRKYESKYLGYSKPDIDSLIQVQAGVGFIPSKNLILSKELVSIPLIPKGPMRLKIWEQYMEGTPSSTRLPTPSQNSSSPSPCNVSTCKTLVPYRNQSEFEQKLFLDPAIMALFRKQQFKIKGGEFCIVPTSQEKVDQVKDLLKKKKKLKFRLFPIRPTKEINEMMLHLLNNNYNSSNGGNKHDGSGDRSDDTFKTKFSWDKCNEFDTEDNLGFELCLIHTDTSERVIERVILGLYVFEETNDGKSPPKYKETHGRYRAWGKEKGDPLQFLKKERLASLGEEETHVKDEKSLRQFIEAVQRYQNFSRIAKSKSKKAINESDPPDYRRHLYEYGFKFQEELTLDVEFSDDEDDKGECRRKEGDLTNFEVNATYKAGTDMRRRKYLRPDEKELKPPLPYTPFKNNGLDYEDQLGVFHDYVPKTKITYHKTHHVFLFKKLKKVPTGYPKTPYILQNTGNLVRREHIINCFKVENAKDNCNNKNVT